MAQDSTTIADYPGGADHPSIIDSQRRVTDISMAAAGEKGTGLTQDMNHSATTPGSSSTVLAECNDTQSPATVTPCDCGHPGGVRLSIDPGADWQSVIGPGVHAGLAPAVNAQVARRCDACPCCRDVCEDLDCGACQKKRQLPRNIVDGRPGYTRCEVRRHNTQESCWLISHKKIYDVTAFLKAHPGGDQAILRHGGQEASQDFDFHSAAGQKLWKPYKIGVVESCATHPEKKGGCVIS